MTNPAMTTAELQALACEDCPAAVTIQRGQGIAGPVLVVFVVHEDSCPWAARCVPLGGATLIRANAMLRHVRASDPAIAADVDDAS